MTALEANANLKSIQALRGFAALAVCLAHLHAVEAKFGGAPLLGNWALSGFAGVDLFFVISGFVMVWVTRGSRGQASALPGFWLARILRIYPLWWLVLSAIVAVWMIKPDWVYSSHLTDPDILRSYLLFPATELPLHAVGWTLIHEVWFYLVFGLLLLAPARVFPFLLLAWGTLVAAIALLLPVPTDPILKLIRHPLTLEFVLGAFIGLLASKNQFFVPAIILRIGLFGLLLSVLGNLANPDQVFSNEWARVGFYGIPAALVVWGWVGLECREKTSSPVWTQSLGNWSYALYLIHVPAFVAVGRLGAPLSREGPFDNLALIGVALSVAIAAAFVLHAVFERPIAKLAHNVVGRIKPKLNA